MKFSEWLEARIAQEAIVYAGVREGGVDYTKDKSLDAQVEEYASMREREYHLGQTRKLIKRAEIAYPIEISCQVAASGKSMYIGE